MIEFGFGAHFHVFFFSFDIFHPHQNFQGSMQNGWIKCLELNQMRMQMPNTKRYSSNDCFKSFTFPGNYVSSPRINDRKKDQISME